MDKETDKPLDKLSEREIDDLLWALRQRLENIEGMNCEVYTRIVGYLRAVANWNPGKEEEYKLRKPYVQPKIS